MQTSIQTIEDLLTKHVFTMPNYQRGYSWEKDNISTLLNDVYSNDNYYLGNILINMNEDGTYEIIDGQQRIITLYLILIAIYQTKKGVITNLDIIKRNMKPLINIESRSNDSTSPIFSYLVENSDVSNAIRSTNEFKGFNIIKKNILNQEYDLNLLYKNICSSNLLVIDSTDLPITPYQLFLNLNTKGKKLTSIDILKSYLFDTLNGNNDFRAYRNNWYELFNDKSESFCDDYLITYAILSKSQNKKRLQSNDALSYLKSLISEEDKAVKFTKNFCSVNGYYYNTYCAVTQDNLESKYISLFNDSSTNLKQLFNYFGFIKKISFKQFNILFMALLNIYSCDENKIKKRRENINKNFHKIESFVQLIFLYASMQQLKNVSPSSYGNKFIHYANELYNDNNNIPQKLSDILDEFKITTLEDNNLNFLDNKEFVQNNSKNMKIAVALITYLDDDSVCNYAGEHCINDSTGSSEAKSFGNIIPVAKDDFGNCEVKDKIKKYIKVKESEKHIKIFLEKDLDKDNNFNPVERMKRYKILFKEKFNNLCDDLLIKKEEK